MRPFPPGKNCGGKGGVGRRSERYKARVYGRLLARELGGGNPSATAPDARDLLGGLPVCNLLRLEAGWKGVFGSR